MTVRTIRSSPSGPRVEVLVPSTADPPDPTKYLSETGEYTVPAGTVVGVDSVQGAGGILPAAPTTGAVVVDGSALLTDIVDVGGGVGLTDGKAGQHGRVKTLQAGAGVVITPHANHVEIATGAAAITFDAIAATPATLTDTAQTIGVVETATIGGPSTINLPHPAADGQIMRVKDLDGTAAANPITVNATGGDQIDGSPTYQIATNFGSVSLVAYAGDWIIF